MIAKLHPHLPYDDIETVDSYIRRLGLFHTGRDGRSLLLDLGVDYRGFVSGSGEAISKLARLAGIDSGRLMAGTIRRKTRYREFRGESWSKEFLRPEGAMVCPECLRQDAVAAHSWMLKGRIAWRLRSVQTCIIHNCRLVNPPRLDGTSDLELIFLNPAIFGNLPAESQLPTGLESSIANRILGCSTGAGAWLDGQTIEQGAKACEMIGATLSHGLTFSHKKLSAEDWRQAGGVGFEIARNGPDAVMEALSRIAAMATTTAGKAGPKAVYGRIYEWLAYTSPVVDFGPIHGLLRESILTTLAIEPDEVLLGQRVESRRLHSVHSLSIRTGLHRKRLRKILVQAGLAAEDSWGVAAHRLVFSVEVVEQLCADIVDSVSLHILPDAIGCSRTQAESLYREGVLRPIVDIDPAQKIGKLAFSRRDIVAFMERIERLPISSNGNEHLVNLVSASKRTGRSTGDILIRVFSGELAAYRDGRQASVNNVRFFLPDLDLIRARQPKTAAREN